MIYCLKNQDEVFFSYLDKIDEVNSNIEDHLALDLIESPKSDSLDGNMGN